MRAFVTGGRGFVGEWLTLHLASCGDEVVVADLDVTDAAAVGAAMVAARPDAVYHLAALAHVGDSWDAAAETLRVNAGGTLSVLEAARSCRNPPRVVLVSSADVYGAVGDGELPLTESSPLRPVSPYAASKVAAEFLGLQAFLAHSLPVLRVRAFNHAGPGQSPSYVLSSMAAQIARAERDGTTVLQLGNLSARRDFTDVRDVVRAYRLLVERGEPGEIYQVCSGEAISIEELVTRLVAMSSAELTVAPHADRVRKRDVPVLWGDPARLVATTGWKPEHDLDDTLRDTLDWWRERAAGGEPGD